VTNGSQGWSLMIFYLADIFGTCFFFEACRSRTWAYVSREVTLEVLLFPSFSCGFSSFRIKLDNFAADFLF